MLLRTSYSDPYALREHFLCTAKVLTSAGFWNFAKRASGKSHVEGKTDGNTSMTSKTPKTKHLTLKFKAWISGELMAMSALAA